MFKIYLIKGLRTNCFHFPVIDSHTIIRKRFFAYEQSTEHQGFKLLLTVSNSVQGKVPTMQVREEDSHGFKGLPYRKNPGPVTTILHDFKNPNHQKPR